MPFLVSKTLKMMFPKHNLRLFNNSLQSNHKQWTIDSYDYLLSRFERIYAERDLDSIGPDEIYTFLESQTHDLAKSTRRLRYAQLKAFYNFIIDRCSLNMKNPCNTSLLRKSYRTPKQVLRKMLEREMVDEMIYNTKGARDRLILELQARCHRLTAYDTISISAMERSSSWIPWGWSGNFVNESLTTISST